MSEQEVLNQIVKHYKAFADYQIDVIERYLKGADGTTNVYGAKEAAQELVNGLDDAGTYLIYPNRFKFIHPKDCMWCNQKPEDKGDELHVFIEVRRGLIEDVRVTSDEAEADNWENDWVHEHGFNDMDDYLHGKKNGHINHYFETQVTTLE